jgi:CBS domain-containing protein
VRYSLKSGIRGDCPGFLLAAGRGIIFQRRGLPSAQEKEADMTIAAILRGRESDKVVSVDPDMPVKDVIALLADKRIGAVPVTEGGRVVGIMSERDVIYRLRSDGAAFLEWPVHKAMTSPVISVPSDTSLLSALAMMTRRRIRHLPVIDGGAVVGFVSIGDLVKARIERIESEAEAMREYIQTA